MVSQKQARSSQLLHIPWSHQVLQEQPELNTTTQVQLLTRDRTESFASVKANNGLSIQPCSGGATVTGEEHFVFGIICKLSSPVMKIGPSRSWEWSCSLLILHLLSPFVVTAQNHPSTDSTPSCKWSVLFTLTQLKDEPAAHQMCYIHTLPQQRNHYQLHCLHQLSKA